jgi:hypothetical protein
MTTSNGSIDFTHTLGSFVLEGHTFQRRKVPAKLWAETLARVGAQETAEMKKKEGSVLFGVSADGLAELIALAVRDEDRPTFQKLYEDGLIEFGELTALRDWVWEQMTERPFTRGQSSSDGPGSSTEASSKDESPSPAEVRTA